MLLIIDGRYEYESELHKRFQELRVTGEWFIYEEKLRSFVKENLNKDRKYEFGFTFSEFTSYEQILRLRTKHNLTLAALGENLQITAQSVKEIQNREKSGTVSIKVLRSVAEALGYKFEYRFTPISGG